MYSDALILVLVWFGAAAGLSVGILRLYVLYQQRSYRLNSQDCALFAATILVIVIAVYHTSMLKFLDETTIFSPRTEISFRMKYTYAGYMLTFTMLWCSKALLATTYWQVFSRLNRRSKIITTITVGYLALSYIAVLLLTLFYCGNPSKNWDVSDLCFAPNEFGYFVAYAVLTGSGDLFLMITGFMILRDLKLMQSRHKKIGVAVVTIIGLMSLCSSFVRWGITARAISFDDRFINARMLIFWFRFEDVTATVACSLPILRAQVRILRDKGKKYEEDRVKLRVRGSHDAPVMDEFAISAKTSVRSLMAMEKE